MSETVILMQAGLGFIKKGTECLRIVNIIGCYKKKHETEIEKTTSQAYDKGIVDK